MSLQEAEEREEEKEEAQTQEGGEKGGREQHKVRVAREFYIKHF